METRQFCRLLMLKNPQDKYDNHAQLICSCNDLIPADRQILECRIWAGSIANVAAYDEQSDEPDT